MGSAKEHIANAITGLEAERDRIVIAIAQLRATLAGLSDDASPEPELGAGVSGFQRKYEMNARALTLAAFRESREAMNVGQAWEAITQRGYDFKKVTVRVNIGKLVAEGLLRQVQAPEGSGYSFSYVLVGEPGEARHDE